MILDVVYNHVGASGVATPGGVRPVLHREVRDAVGQGDQLRRRRLRPGARVGAPERRPAGSATSASTACASTRSTRSSTRAPSTSSRRSPAASTTVDPRRARDRRERAQRPARDAAERGAAATGCDAAWADDFHHALRALLTERARRLLRRVRPRRPAGQGLPPPARPRRRLLGASAAGASAPRPTTYRRSGSSSSPRTTTRSATAPSATGCRRATRPLAAFCTLLSPFVPMLFMGEEYGEQAPFQFFSDHIDREIAEATREGRRGSSRRSPSSAAGGPGPAGPSTFARSKLTRERDDALAGLYAAAARAPRAAARRRRRDRVRRGGALAAGAARPLRAGLQLRAASRRAYRARGPRCTLCTHASRRSATATSSCPRCPGR